MNSSTNLADKALRKFLSQEQEFFQKLIEKQFTMAQILPLIEEKSREIAQNNFNNSSILNGLKHTLGQELYTDITFLGSGCNGTVFSVKKGAQRQAAKSFQSSDVKLSSKIIEEFQHQTKMRDCKYVVTCRGMSSFHDYHFIFLEQCLCSLQAVLSITNPPSNEKVVFNEPTVIKVSYEIASGFAFVHNKGTAIRDIKPDNIMVNFNLECQISDFGMSKHITQSANSSIAGGNNLFKAPEIYDILMKQNQLGAQQPDDKDKIVNEQMFIKSDLFSLGVLMCYIILGEEEFQFKLLPIISFNKTQQNLEKFIKIVSEKLASYKSRDTLLPIIKSLLSHNPEGRMQSKEVQMKLQPLFKSFGFENISPFFLSQDDSNLVSSMYPNDVELIPSFNKQNNLSISQRLQEQIFPNRPFYYLKGASNTLNSSDIIFTETKIGQQANEEQQQLNLKKNPSIVTDFSTNGLQKSNGQSQMKCSIKHPAVKKQKKSFSLRHDLKAKCFKIVKEVHHYGKFSSKDIEVIKIEDLSRRWIYLLLLLIVAVSACEIVGDTLELFGTATTLSQPKLRYMRVALQGVQYLSAYVLIMKLFMLNHHECLPLYSILALIPQAPASAVSLINNFQVFSFGMEFSSKMYYIAIGLQAITAISGLIGLYKAWKTHSFSVNFKLNNRDFNFKAFFSKHDVKGLYEKVEDEENGQL